MVIIIINLNSVGLSSYRYLHFIRGTRRLGRKELAQDLMIACGGILLHAQLWDCKACALVLPSQYPHLFLTSANPDRKVLGSGWGEVQCSRRMLAVPVLGRRLPAVLPPYLILFIFFSLLLQPVVA